jgi:Lsr2
MRKEEALMSREVAIRIWDDVIREETGGKVEASVTVTIGLDGLWTELDLTAENDAQLREELSRWLRAGRPVKAPERLAREPREKKSYPGLRLREWERGRAYGTAIRAFAIEHGIPYTTPGSDDKYYYSRELRDAYAESIGMA